MISRVRLGQHPRVEHKISEYMTAADLLSIEMSEGQDIIEMC